MYTVKKGDSLWSIAKNNNTSVDKLKSLNNLDSNMLSVGMKLKLPKEESVSNDNVYVVKSGDTLYSISSKLGVSVSDLKSANNLSSDVLSVGQELIKPGVSTLSDNYTVKAGDSLYSISKKYNISVDKLKSLNNLTSNTLSIGQTLKVKSDSNIVTSDYDYYTVKKGDTLYSISNKFGVSVNEIKSLNNLSDNNLGVGTLLKIPDNDKIYVVKKGDSLWSISKDNNISVDELKSLNNLNSNNLSIGQKLLLK